ncbi:MAG: anion transporter [Flavobacteriaceae bacterium]|nr:anion transporter [Flavobacteriaceae bacterium]|tara:strand:+ start:4294 stop:5736 length:1443 start_codon:yes stop_codon:yes gene_type:complete
MFTKERIGLILGPLTFILIQFIPIYDLSPEGKNVLATAVWMAIWWVLESVDIAVTALLPIVLFPLTESLSIAETTSQYGHNLVFLYLGGFIIAIAIERWNLHKRIALNIISAMGTKIDLIILGFMISTAILSMFISNTATTVMMLPIAIAIIKQLDDNPSTIINENKEFGKALLLAVAYSASIGGIATLFGTPPNMVLKGIVETNFGYKITFIDWLMVGFPISVILLFLCWIYMTRKAYNFAGRDFSLGKNEITSLKQGLGKISVEEKRVAIIFILTALCWIFRSKLELILPGIDDTVIAITFGLVLFIVPTKNRQRALITWREAVTLPWGVIILFGGGMALAKGFVDSGLSNWFGNNLSALQGLPVILIILSIVAAVNFLTEMTSNLATTAMLLPVLAALGLQMNIDPLILMIGATIAASCAFMLPVATPPNAIVFGAGYLRIPDMVEKGFRMNFISIIIITAMVYFLVPALLTFSIEG